jgi:YVTN family beta-propeller protein
VANSGSSNVTVIDGNSNKITQTVTVGASPQSLTINTLTNHIYVADLKGNAMTDIDGATNVATSAVPSQLNAPSLIAVDPANSLIWMVNNGSNIVTEFRPSLNLSPINITVGNNPDGLGVNPVTDKIYVSSPTDSTISIIDGASNAPFTNVTPSAPTTIPDTTGPVSIAINPVTNQIYVTNLQGKSVTAITEQNVQSIPLTTTISPASNNQPGSTTLGFTFAASTSFSLAVQGVYYQLDTWQGPWTAATGTSPNFSGTVTAQPGTHILYAFAFDAQGATWNGQAPNLIGQIAAYFFVVLPAPSAQLSNTSRDFGSQLVGVASASQIVTLTNSGNGALTITSIVLGGTDPGDFTEGDNCGTSLAAGASCTLTVIFKPTAINSRAATITITDNDASGSQILNLSGTGVATAPNAALSPTSMTFGSLPLGTASPAQTATLTNNGNATLHITSIVVAGTNASSFTENNNCGTPPTSLTAGSSCAINVTFKPAVSGALTASVIVADDAGSLSQIINLSGTGTSTPGASLSVTSLSFGNVGTGTTSPAQTATLTNNGTGTLTITGITVTGTNASDYALNNTGTTCGTSLAINTSCVISVTFTPGAATARTASIAVADNATGSPQMISLSGTGVTSPPTVSLSVASLSFSTTYVGVAATAQTITLTNSGGAALSITGPGIAVSGTNSTDFAQTNTCGTSVAAGAKCTISVTFTPGGTGARSASITINDNVSGSPQSITLSGAGIAASLAVATGSSASQTVKAGLAATYNLQLTATGGAASTDQVSATITCTGAPAHSTCSAPSVAVSATPATPGTFSITVKTTGSNKPSVPIAPFARRIPPAGLPVWLLALVLFFYTMAMLGWTRIPAGRLRPIRMVLAACLVLLPMSAATMLTGCGPAAASTKPGTYTLTVTATIGSQTKTTQLTLIVQ